YHPVPAASPDSRPAEYGPRRSHPDYRPYSRGCEDSKRWPACTRSLEISPGSPNTEVELKQSRAESQQDSPAQGRKRQRPASLPSPYLAPASSPAATGRYCNCLDFEPRSPYYQGRYSCLSYRSAFEKAPSSADTESQPLHNLPASRRAAPHH